MIGSLEGLPRAMTMKQVPGIIIAALLFAVLMIVDAANGGRLLSSPSTMIWLGVIWFVYVFPSFVADKRYHRQRWAILALNLLLGWTFIGWVAALVWALTSDVDDTYTDAGRERHWWEARP